MRGGERKERAAHDVWGEKNTRKKFDLNLPYKHEHGCVSARASRWKKKTREASIMKQTKEEERRPQRRMGITMSAPGTEAMCAALLAEQATRKHSFGHSQSPRPRKGCV